MFALLYPTPTPATTYQGRVQGREELIDSLYWIVIFLIGVAQPLKGRYADCCVKCAGSKGNSCNTVVQVEGRVGYMYRTSGTRVEQG